MAALFNLNTAAWLLAVPPGVLAPASLKAENISRDARIGLWVGTSAPAASEPPADVVYAGQDATVELSAGEQLYVKALDAGDARALVAINIGAAGGQAERSAEVDIQYEYFLATAAFADVQIGDRLRKATLTNLATGTVTASWINTSQNNAAVTNPPASALAVITPAMLTEEQLRAALNEFNDQYAYGWETTAGELTAQLRRARNGQLQRSQFTKNTSTPGTIIYVPGPWLNVGEPA